MTDHLIKNIPAVTLLALALVIPTYITFFIGKEPLIQGLAFSIYALPLLVMLFRSRTLHTSGRLIFFWALFLAAWVIPSLINAAGSHLESELVRLPVLFFHVTILTLLVVTLYHYLKPDPEKNFHQLVVTMFWALLPISLLIALKTLYLEGYNPTLRPSPFGIHPNVAAEVMLVFLLCATQVRQATVKWLAYAVTIATCYLLQSRGGLIASYLALFILYGYPLVTQKNLQKKSTLAIGGLLVMGLLFFYQDLYDLILKASMLDMRTQDIAGRGQVWLLGLESIMARPWTGLGFWVNPMGYSIPAHLPGSEMLGHPALEIHNAFIRIATENGLVLLAMTLGLMGFAAHRLHRDKNYPELATLMSVTFFLCFATRHLTLNLMNVLLYMVILKATLPSNPKKRSKRKTNQEGH